MDRYRVEWADSARRELLEIIGYIAAENQSNAKSIYKKIMAKTTALEKLPYKCRIVPELEAFDIHLYREVIEFPWRIIYRIHGSTVVIMTILDGRRDIEDILFKKMIL